MRLTNAIKKLSKYGQVQQNGGEFYTVINGQVVSFRANGRIETDTIAICFHVRRVGDNSDAMTDYFPGTFTGNLTGALRLAGAIKC